MQDILLFWLYNATYTLTVDYVEWAGRWHTRSSSYRQPWDRSRSCSGLPGGWRWRTTSLYDGFPFVSTAFPPSIAGLQSSLGMFSTPSNHPEMACENSPHYHSLLRRLIWGTFNSKYVRWFCQFTPIVSTAYDHNLPLLNQLPNSRQAIRTSNSGRRTGISTMEMRSVTSHAFCILYWLSLYLSWLR